MRKKLVLLHRWLGLPLGLLMLITFGTGFITALAEALSRYSPYQTPHYQPPSVEQQALALTQMSHGQKSIRQVTMPQSQRPFYQLVSAEQRLTYSAADMTVLDTELRQKGGFFSTILQLHRNYLLAKDGLLGIKGSDLAAWVGLLGLLLSLLGLWLWWPLRRQFMVKAILPRGQKRSRYIISHFTSGVVMLVVIGLLSITGASIAYRSITYQLLGIDPQPPQQLNIALEPNWNTWLSTAYNQFPDGQLDRIRFSKNAKTQVTQLELFFITPADWLGLATSKVIIDQDASALVAVRGFNDLMIGQKIAGLIVPLHSGRGLSGGYVWLLMVFSLMGCLMISTGLISWLSKLRRKMVNVKLAKFGHIG